MEINDLLEKLMLLRSEPTISDQSVQILEEYLKFEKAQLEESSNNLRLQEFHNENILLISELIENFDRGCCAEDALVFYYSYSIYNYKISNAFLFKPIIDDFQEQLSKVDSKNFNIDILKYLSLKSFAGAQQIVFDMESSIANNKNIFDVYRLCRIIIYDSSFLQSKLIYGGERRFGYYILFDILGNKFSNIIESSISLMWKEKFVNYCNKNGDNIPKFYSVLSKLKLALYCSKVDQTKAKAILESIEIPSFEINLSEMGINDSMFMYGVYITLLDNLSDYETISEKCDDILLGMKDNNYKNRWLFEYICKYKTKALTNLDINIRNNWFFNYIKEIDISEIGNLIFLSPYIESSDDRVDIYHFSDITALKSIIENKKFWLTRYDYLNDTEEMKFIVTVIQSVLPELEGDFAEYVLNCVNTLKEYFNSEFDKLDEKVLLKNIKNCISNVYILSTSMKDDNLSLWHYYSGGTGASIHFNSETLKNQIELNNDSLRNLAANVFMRKIDYLSNLESGKIINILQNLFENTNDLNDLEKLYLGCIHILFEGIFAKNKNMEQEEEYRIVVVVPTRDSFPNPNEQITERFRVRDGNSFVPYIELNISPKGLIENIRIAPLNKSDIAKRGLIDYLAVNDFENSDKIVQLSEIKLRY